MVVELNGGRRLADHVRVRTDGLFDLLLSKMLGTLICMYMTSTCR